METQLQQFITSIEDASIIAIKEFINETNLNPYSFALYIDSDASSISPSLNTKEHLEKMVLKYPSDASYVKWTPSEWSHEFFGAEHFEGSSVICRQLPRSTPQELNSTKDVIAECCITAMEKLKIIYPQLKDIIYLFSVTDEDPTDKAINLNEKINNYENSTEYKKWISSIT